MFRLILRIVFLYHFLSLFLFASAADNLFVRIGASGDALNGVSPLVEINGGTQVRLSYDPQLRAWVTPLRESEGSYISVYKLSVPMEGGAFPVQMNFPVFIMRKDPAVYFYAPSKKWDEPTIRSLWSNSERAFNHDPKIQFRYLHTLLYINEKIQKEGRLSANPTWASTLASYMLLQVIDSLRHRTWYVMDSRTEYIADNAISTLRVAKNKNKLCGWIKTPECKIVLKDTESLISRVRNIEFYHFNKIYEEIYKQGAIPSVNFCKKRIAGISRFLDYIARDSKAGDDLPSRVAEELATCYVTLALCQAEISLSDSIGHLNSAESALMKVESDRSSWKARLQDVRKPRQHLKDGGGRSCPSRDRSV